MHKLYLECVKIAKSSVFEEILKIKWEINNNFDVQIVFKFENVLIKKIFIVLNSYGMLFDRKWLVNFTLIFITETLTNQKLRKPCEIFWKYTFGWVWIMWTSENLYRPTFFFTN